VALINNNTQKKTTKTEPDLVTFYDIQPRNGEGLFLQPRSPHRADYGEKGRLNKG